MPVGPSRDQHAGSVELALSQAKRLLAERPDLAEDQAREILKVSVHPQATLILGMALHRQGLLAQARTVLEPLASSQPGAPSVHYEFGLVLAGLGESRAARTAFERAVALRPAVPDFWRALGDQLTVLGECSAADNAYARQIQASVNDPDLMEAANALVLGQLAVAEHRLRGFLRNHPTDVVAMRMLAEAGTRLGRYHDVELILERCLELAPTMIAARYNMAVVLYRQNRAADALPHIELLLSDDPCNLAYRNLHAASLSLVGEYAKARSIYEDVLAEVPIQPLIWLTYGHVLRTCGVQGQAIVAYRRALEQMPDLGEAYFSLANLKTVSFSAADVTKMLALLDRDGVSVDDRLHVHYALGKAFEDAGDTARSFDHYSKGAAIRRGQISYDAAENRTRNERYRALFTRAFFEERAGSGSPSPDPIFIVGLPRSGSTLVEQILASHPAIEGTMELPDLNKIAVSLGDRRVKDGDPQYLLNIASLEPDRLRELGETYLERTRIQRKTSRPLFIDKMPNNFQHVGLIQLILPNAKIIDARRHPMASCFSAFKQHFARGQNFSYDLDEIGRYYRDYVSLMTHFDAVLPGRIHRVAYERMVENQEAETRLLLDYIGLPFDPACMRFHENDRAVRTASSEQVRQPIYRAGLDRWRSYEPWLGPLKAALGDLVESGSDCDHPADLIRS